jgi:hypothetical protein
MPLAAPGTRLAAQLSSWPLAVNSHIHWQEQQMTKTAKPDTAPTHRETQHTHQTTAPSEKDIDHTVEDTFPASDPPSHGGVTKIVHKEKGKEKPEDNT